MEKQEKRGKIYYLLLALTVVFLCAVGLLSLRDRAFASPDTYTVKTERSASGDVIPERTLLDINTATAEQLEDLMGIGPVLAQAIVDYRTEHGPFSSVDELLEVSGIGEGQLAGIEDQVTVGSEEGSK